MVLHYTCAELIDNLTQRGALFQVKEEEGNVFNHPIHPCSSESIQLTDNCPTTSPPCSSRNSAL